MNTTNTTIQKDNAMETITLENITLAKGSHSSPEQGMCVMEAVAYINRLPFTDNPPCTSPVIASFLRSWNDTLDDADRNRLLKPLIPMLAGTAGDKAAEDRRVWMIIDWLIRDFTPPWLRLAKLDTEADALATVAEINSVERVEAASRAIAAAKDKAAAAWAAAAWAAAARTAAGDAARAAAALPAAWAAAWAAAALPAAWAAAWAAAGDAAAWAAAGETLRPTTEALQSSAVKLIKKLCEVK